MADFDTQINVGMNVDGVVSGTEKAKRSVRDLGESAREAGRGTGAIGDGMAQSAQKVEAATKNMVGSLQRQIAATEAGDKSTRAYQESLARMRGVDVGVLKPYLDQLDAAKEKAGRAAKANSDLGSSFGDLGSRSVFAANAVAMVGAAVGAAFSAASIKAVIDVADTFAKLSQKSGVAVESLRELNYAASLSDVSTESLGNGLRKLSQNMASAAGGGKEQAAAFAAVGVSIKGLDGNLKGADQVLSEVASKFANFSDGPEKAALAMELFGKQGADLIPLLNGGASGLSEMAAEAQGLGIVFGSSLAKNAEAFNDNLTRIQTSAEGAKIAIANELLPTLNLLAQAFVDAQKSGSGFGSFIGGALRTVIEAATILYANVEFTLKGVGREFRAIGAQLVALGKLDLKGFRAISEAVKEDGIRARAELDKFQFNLLNAGILTSKAGAGRGTAPDPRSLGSTETTAPIVAAEKATANLNKELKEQNERMKINRELAMQMGDEVTKANDAYQKALADSTKENQKYVDSLDKSADAVAAQVLKLQDEEQALRISQEQHISLAEAISQVEIARLREKQAIELSFGNDAAAQAIQREIDARKQLATFIDSKDAREASGKAAKEAESDWKKAAEKINDSITDALLRGFESGKGFAENLRDTVTNMFKTMVLRPTVSAIVTGLSGGAFGGAANAATTATGLSNAGGLIGGVGQMAAIGTAFGEGFVSTLAGNSLTVAAQAAGGGTLAGIGGAIGAVAPYALAAAAVYTLLTREKNYVKSTGDAAVNFGATGGVTSASDFKGQSYEANVSTAANKFVTDLNAEYLKAAKTLDLGAVASAFAFGSNDAGKFRIGGSAGGVGFDSGELDQSPEAIKLAASRAVFAAIQGSELPKYLSGVFDNITASTATQEQIADAIAAAQALKGFYDQVQASPFENIKDLTFQATKGLIEFSGGLDKLATNLGTYYTEFYSAEEKRAQTLKNIAKTLNDARSEVGPVEPLTAEQIGSTTREQFRAAAEGINVTTVAGQKLYAAMLSVSGAFAGVTESSADIAKAAKEAADAEAKRNTQMADWQSKLDILNGKTTESQAELAAALAAVDDPLSNLDDPLKALITNFYTLKTATDDLAESARVAASIRTSAQSVLLNNGTLGGATAAETAVTRAQFDLTNSIQAVRDLGTKLGVKGAQNFTGADIEKAANDFGQYLGQSFTEEFATLIADYYSASAGVLGANTALSDAKTAAADKADKDAADKAKPGIDAALKIAEQRAGLQDQYDKLTLSNVDLLAKQRAALDESNRALFDNINLETARQALEAQTGTLADRLAVATGTSTEREIALRKELEGALNASNAATITAIYAAEDLATANEKAAATAAQLAQTNGGLKDRLDILTGAQTDRSIALRDATDDSTKALLRQIYAQEDLQDAAEKAAAATEAAYQAYQNIGDSLIAGLEREKQAYADTIEKMDAFGDSLKRFRGELLLDNNQGAQAYAIANERFILTAEKASIGNEDALQSLPETITALLKASAATSTSGESYARDVGRSNAALSVAERYTSTASGAAQFKLDNFDDRVRQVAEFYRSLRDVQGFATGTNYIPQDMLAMVHKGEAIVPAVYNPANGGVSNNDALVAEVRALRAEMAAMRATNEVIATAATNSNKTLTRVTRGGEAMQTQVFS